MHENGKVNILLVDEQPANLHTYETILNGLDRNLIKASSGREALQQLQNSDIAVVLMDMSIPELDGFELAEVIRRYPEAQKPAIIFVSSGYVMDLTQLNGYDYGVVDYVSAPIIPEVLQAKVNVFAELYRKTRQLEELNRELEQRVADRTTELEMSMARLRKSEELYRHLVHPLPVAIYTCDLEGRITLFNEAAVGLWGRRPEVGEDLWCGSWRIYYPDGTPMPLDTCPMAVAIKEGRSVRGQEVIIERPDGVRVYVLPYPDPIRDDSGAVIGAVNMLVDLTERRQTEEQLRQQAHILETLNQVNMSLAAELDLERLIQAVTDAATSLSGAQFGAFFYNVEGEQGELYTLYSLSGAPREAFERFPMPRNTAIFGPTFRGEAVIRLDDVTQDPNYGQNPPYKGMPEGHLPVRSYLAVPVISRTGEVIGGFFLGHPEPGVFTEQAEQLVVGVASQAAIAIDNARLYEEAQQLNTELEQRVDERTAALERSLEELNQFTYVASHDLKAPLRGVKHLASWIVEDVGDLLPETSKVHLSKLQDRIEGMEKLLNDLLLYSRVNREYYQNLERVDTGRLIKGVIDILSPPSGFTIQVQENMPVLTTYRMLLEIIFKNLIENGIRHHHRSTGQIQISAREVGNFIEFSVTDDGPGIAPIFHERIFEIFQTLQPQNKSQGTGAGLAIVKKAVESQDAAITVISTEGQGSTFRFTWPKG